MKAFDLVRIRRRAPGVRRWQILGRIKVVLTPGAVSLCVYIATMFPGLAAIGDTPKFQFVGAVLGIPHSPGYPLYVLLSWVFSKIPIATIAFRANLMSAVFGSAAVALAAATLLELGCAPMVAVGPENGRIRYIGRFTEATT